MPRKIEYKRLGLFIPILCIVLVGMTVMKKKPESIPATSGAVISKEANAEKPKKIALTFDDGPHPRYTERILDVLKKRNVKATFFVLGKNIEGRENIVKRIQEEGHLIGNHTYSHVCLTSLRVENGRKELDHTNQCIYDVTGVYPTYVRPPFGKWREGLECKVDMIPVMWTIDSKDWQLKNSDKIVNNVLKKAKEGDIILMHDWYDATVKASIRVIDKLLEQGYDFVTVDELL